MENPDIQRRALKIIQLIQVLFRRKNNWRNTSRFCSSRLFKIELSTNIFSMARCNFLLKRNYFSSTYESSWKEQFNYYKLFQGIEN